MEWQDWLLWAVAFASVGGPVGALVFDRAIGISGRAVRAACGLPGLAVLAGACIYTAAAGRALCDLLAWGFVGGVAGTILLDLVRLGGVRLGTLPLDMPQMFGAVAPGIAPQLQAHAMSELVGDVSRPGDEEREQAMLPRIEAVTSMSSARRRAAASAMMHGLAHLPERRRPGMLRTRMAIPIGFFAVEYVSDAGHEASIAGAGRALTAAAGAAGSV